MIREAVRSRLAVKHAGEDAIIMDELRVARGSARVDVAVVNGLIEGYEIKSDRDDLKRLERQAALYGKVADRMTLVVGERHHAAAVDIVPDWWGVTIAQRSASGCKLCNVRTPKRNRERDPHSLVSMLDRGEVLTLLSVHSLAKGTSRLSYTEIAVLAARSIRTSHISTFVKSALKVRARYGSLDNCSAFGRSVIVCGPSAIGVDLP